MEDKFNPSARKQESQRRRKVARALKVLAETKLTDEEWTHLMDLYYKHLKEKYPRVFGRGRRKSAP